MALDLMQQRNLGLLISGYSAQGLWTSSGNGYRYSV